MSEPEDEPHLDGARRGDRAALERLLREHQPRLHAVCRRMVGNDADASDACQEALVAIVRGLPRFDGRSRFSTWTHRIAVNASIDELRRRGRRPTPLDDEALHPTVDRGDALGGSGRSGRSSADSETRIDLDRALQRLPVEFRAVVVLRDLCGLDYGEIAEVLDLPPGTVRSRISRGRAALAPLLGTTVDEVPDDREPVGPSATSNLSSTATEDPA